MTVNGNALVGFHIDWDPLCCLPPIGSLQTTYEKAHFKAKVTQVSKALSAFHPLCLYVSGSLGAQKLVLGDPAVRSARVILTNDPKETAYFRPKANLYAEIFCEPLRLPEPDANRKELGTLGVNFANAALKKFALWDNFPTKLIESELRKFEADHYTYVWQINRKLLDKKATQLILTGRISPTQTICTVHVRRNEEVLYSSTVWETGSAQWQLANLFKNVSIAEGRLVIGPTSDRIVKAFSISLDDLPHAAQSAMLTRSGSFKR